MTDDEKYLCSTFCGGISQDYDVMFSTPKQMVEFCFGFLIKDEKIRFVKTVKEIKKMQPVDQLSIWNSYCEDTFFKNEGGAVEFTKLILDNAQKSQKI